MRHPLRLSYHPPLCHDAQDLTCGFAFRLPVQVMSYCCLHDLLNFSLICMQEFPWALHLSLGPQGLWSLYQHPVRISDAVPLSTDVSSTIWPLKSLTRHCSSLCNIVSRYVKISANVDLRSTKRTAISTRYRVFLTVVSHGQEFRAARRAGIS